MAKISQEYALQLQERDGKWRAMLSDTDEAPKVLNSEWYPSPEDAIAAAGVYIALYLPPDMIDEVVEMEEVKAIQLKRPNIRVFI